jgi:hypothetical protein
VKALKEFIENNCKGYAEKAGKSLFMGIPLDQLNKNELLAIIWYQEQDNKVRLKLVEKSSRFLGEMSALKHHK